MRTTDHNHSGRTPFARCGAYAGEPARASCLGGRAEYELLKHEWCPSPGVILRQPELLAQSVGGYHRTDPPTLTTTTAVRQDKGVRKEI